MSLNIMPFHWDEITVVFNGSHLMFVVNDLIYYYLRGSFKIFTVQY